MEESSRDQAQAEFSLSPNILNFVSGETRIEVKWCISDGVSDREVWWAGTIFGEQDNRTVRYDARPDLGFFEAEILPVVFSGEFGLYHPKVYGEEDMTMQWRFEGDDRDADDVNVEDFDGQGRAIDVIRHNLLGEISTRPMDVQGILASEIHHALETFRDEIHREMSTAEDGIISDQNAQDIISRIKSRLG